MDVLKAQFDRIQQQLSGLSASQKMLTASLVAIMLMTLLWWARYAGVSEMQPVLNQALPQEEIPRIKGRLTASAIPARVEGDRVLVPADRRDEAIAILAYERLLPRDTSSSWAQIVEQISPLGNDTNNSRIWNLGLQQALERVIVQMPGVAHASVIVDQTRIVRVQGGVEPSAAVNVSMRNGEKPTRKLIEGIADTVAGSVASMDRARVRIIVDGMPYNVDNRDSTVIGHSSDYIEAEMAATRAYEDQVRRILAYFSGDVLVSVRVKIDTVSSQTQETRIDKIDQKEATIETESTTAIGPASVGGEPGTASNTGLALGSGEASSPGSSLEKERTRTDFLNLPSQTQETRVKRGGDVTPVSATVRVPHQQLIEMMKAKVGGTSTADEETLNRYVSEELASIHKAVKNTLKLQDDEVFVDTYVSTMPAMIAAAAGDVPAAGISGSLTSHAKEIAIGALAVISLVMVSMMVRKSGPATTLPAPIDQNDAHRILAAEHFVGEAISSSTTLDGMELDDDALRAQQMVEQVSTMVKENPESAANLVKRWLNRS